MSASSSSKGKSNPRSLRAKAKGIRRQPGPSSGALAQDLIHTDAARSVTMLEQLFCVVMEFAHQQNVSPQQAGAAFKRAQRQLRRSPYRVADAVRFEILTQVADLLETWYRDVAFLDETGRPRRLPLEGAKSFTTLARRHLPSYDPQHLAELMIHELLLRAGEDGLMVPRNRAASFAEPNAMMLDRIPVLVHGLLSTFAHNTSEGSRARGTRCERNSSAQIPVELVPAFDETVKGLAHSMLDKIDAWSRQREVVGGHPPARQTARVGVEVFSFVEFAKRRKAR